MLNKLQAVVNKFEELCFKSEQPDFYADPKKAAKLLREKNDLEPIVEAFQAYKQAEQDMLDAQELMSDPEMKELCQETYTAAKEQKEALFEKLQILLLPRIPMTRKASSWKSAAVLAVRKVPSLPTAFSGCTPCTPPSVAGAWSFSTTTKQSWAA